MSLNIEFLNNFLNTTLPSLLCLLWFNNISANVQQKSTRQYTQACDSIMQIDMSVKSVALFVKGRDSEESCFDHHLKQHYNLWFFYFFYKDFVFVLMVFKQPVRRVF